MGTPAKNKKKPTYPVFKMEGKGKLILPPEIISQITYLHSHIGKEEWSGMLLYDVVKGNPSDPDNFELEAKHIFLMDIGSAAYTEYEPDGDIVDIYDNLPEAMGWKTGHIHTHHNMGSYFSGTDMDELNENTDKHNYYLSLIVAFDGNYTAKVAFMSDMNTVAKMNYLDDSGKTKNFKKSKTEKHLVTIDMRIYFGDLGGFFAERLTGLKKKEEEAKKEAERKRKASYGGGYGGYNSGRQWNPKTQRMEDIPSENHNRQLPISSKIIPDKMTSWEIERLTRNVLMLDEDLKTQGNVYAILHDISRQDEVTVDLFYEYLLGNAEMVIDAFFDVQLSYDEYIIIVKEIIMCVKKFEGLPALSELVENVIGVFELMISAFEEQGEDNSDESERNLAEKDIADQLEQAEREIT